MRGIVAIAVIALSVACCAAPAAAHAYLDHAEPRVGSTVTAPPVVKIWFSESPLAAQTRITVSDSAGKQVDRGDVRVDPDDDTLLSVAVAPLAAGTYTVTWQAVCENHHHTHGSYRFTVKE